MKKTIFIIMMIFNMLCMAQYNRPEPPDGPGGWHPGHEEHHHMAGPVGTATCLMLALGAGYTVYKIKKKK